MEMIGISVSRTSAAAIASRKRSRAGAMYGVWNAPDTGSDITRVAPSSCASVDAASTPIRDPAITTCPGALKLAIQTSSSASSAGDLDLIVVEPEHRGHRARTLQCRLRASPPPASTTSRMPSSKSIAPVADSAVYSPRLWPAQKLASMPMRSTASSTIRLDTNVVSWALRVSFSSSASASSNSLPTSRPVTSLASSTSSQLS